MGSFSIAPNSVAVADDRLVQVLGVTEDGQVEIRDLVSGATSTCSAQILRAADNVQDVGALPFEQVTAEQWESALKRERAVLQILVVRSIKTDTYQVTPRSNLFQRNTTGDALISAIPLRMRSFRSSLDVTRMWRRNVRAILEKAHSIKLSHEPCLGV